MGKIVKLKLKKSGVRSLLRSKEMRELCLEQARAVQGRCGNGYETDSYRGENRVNAMVWPETAAARRDNYHNNTLEKALGGQQ